MTKRPPADPIGKLLLLMTGPTTILPSTRTRRTLGFSMYLAIHVMGV